MLSQPSTPFTPDSLTRALWHFNELSGTSIADSSGLGNNGTSGGATIVSGRFGNARYFNGSTDMAVVTSDSTLNVDTSGFSIDLWFRTSSTQGVFIRKGLVNSAGYQLSMYYGHIAGTIGNHVGHAWTDTLLMIVSVGTYNDNQWHLATFARDRSTRQIRLFIDNVQDAQPVTDLFPFSLSNDEALTMGAWIGGEGQYAGAIDEVRLSWARSSRQPKEIEIVPSRLNFGTLVIPDKDTLSLTLLNSGYRDTLHVSSLLSNNPRFSVKDSALAIPPSGSFIIPVVTRRTRQAATREQSLF